MIINRLGKTVLLSTSLAFLWGTAALASELFNAVTATPYDGRLTQVGVFDQAALPPSEIPATETIDTLFAKARSFRYLPDGRNDQWQSPEETEARWAGDCEDKAIWLYDHLRRNGYNDTQLIVGKKAKRDRSLHVWVEYTDSEGTKWLLDPTANRRAWKMDGFSTHSYQKIYSFDGVHRFYYSYTAS